ncbi:FAD-dependent monooxygenase [Streptomyces sp. PRKS01-29]|nr:FAD-dependent monooxygenase [Streptomyces sabulosicollis]
MPRAACSSWVRPSVKYTGDQVSLILDQEIGIATHKIATQQGRWWGERRRRGGAGPVGLLLAAELRLAGVDVTVLERAAARSPHSKALTLPPRSLEVLAMRGLAEPFLREGEPVPTGHYGGLPVRLDFSVLDTRFPYTLVLPQLRTEQLLEERLRAPGGEIRWEHRALEVRQDADGAEVDVAGPDGTYTLRAVWVAGCDGAGSAVRTSAGSGLPRHRAPREGRGTADARAAAGAIAGDPDRMRAVTARPTTAHDGWTGRRTVLVRPDGHVAWDAALSTT